MSTNLQKNLAENIVKNLKRKKPLNKKELVVSSGYGAVSAESSAHIILEQKGVQEELENLGFTESNAKKVVAEILLDPKQKGDTRINAAKEVFKVEGSYAPEKTQALNLNIEAHISNPKLKELNDEYNRKVIEALKDESTL